MTRQTYLQMWAKPEMRNDWLFSLRKIKKFRFSYTIEASQI